MLRDTFTKSPFYDTHNFLAEGFLRSSDVSLAFALTNDFTLT